MRLNSLLLGEPQQAAILMEGSNKEEGDVQPVEGSNKEREEGAVQPVEGSIEEEGAVQPVEGSNEEKDAVQPVEKSNKEKGDVHQEAEVTPTDSSLKSPPGDEPPLKQGILKHLPPKEDGEPLHITQEIPPVEPKAKE